MNKVSGLEVLVGGLAVTINDITENLIIITPPNYNTYKEHKAQMKALSRPKREGSRKLREADDDVTDAPDKRSHDKKYSSEYMAIVTVKLGNWKHTAGKLYYTKSPSFVAPPLFCLLKEPICFPQMPFLSFPVLSLFVLTHPFLLTLLPGNLHIKL